MDLETLINSTEYFTAKDASITSTGARDPLGFEALWSYLGRQIFDNKVTSIANDVRNYTLNLLHHAVVREMKKNGTLTRIREHLQRDPNVGEIRESETVVAVLIFLENLLVYSMIRGHQVDGESVKTEGVLGTAKGLTSRFDKIWISPRKDAFVLVNQANVGLNARYKTPFQQMEFFDSTYNYEFQRETYPDVWKRVSTLEDEFQHLQQALVRLVQNMTGNGRSGSLEMDLTQLFPEVKDIVKQYRHLFADPDMASYPRICKFWIDMLGFNDAPACYIYDAVQQNEGQNDKRLYRGFVQTARQQAEPDDADFSAILEVENVLAPVRYVFDLLLSGQYKDIADEQFVQEVSDAIANLRRHSPENLESRFSDASPQAKARIHHIADQLLSQNGPEIFIRKLLSYHTKVVKQRRNEGRRVYRNPTEGREAARTCSSERSERQPRSG